MDALALGQDSLSLGRLHKLASWPCLEGGLPVYTLL